MKQDMLRKWRSCGLALLLGLAWGCSASAQSISGTINNGSLWSDRLGFPPGDGNGWGMINVQAEGADGSVLAVQYGITNGMMPFLPGPYDYTLVGALGGGTASVTVTVRAWVDGDTNRVWDLGEPFGLAAVTIVSNNVTGVKITISDDSDKDDIPDWWEVHWFQFAEKPLSFGSGDVDGDGLTDLEEYQLSSGGYGLDGLNPADWDTDKDGMDDGWECRYFDTQSKTGMNAVVYNGTNAFYDFDGDGLSDWQEYCGVDGYPRMVFDQVKDGVRKGKLNPQAPVSDDINPIDIDTDFDMLLDSFEAAWYDPANSIDPHPIGISIAVPATGVPSDTTIAQADSDHDGLSNFREQCQLAQLRQSSTNSWLWNWSGSLPFAFRTYVFQGKTYRLCTMWSCGGQALPLNLVMNRTISATTNRFMLRNHEWTDPTEGTGYTYVDEAIPPGHDTDNDGMPDGWEVQFGLNPRNDGFDGTWTDGPFGDPDEDGLMNIDEFLGQDGQRSTTLRYINGTGDETNPNQYNSRPDSTYPWRWINTDATVITAASEREMGSPRRGIGISRQETLGSASPTTGLSTNGLPDDLAKAADTDDDGIPDGLEISPTNSVLTSSPVDSCDPFIPRAALITSPGGIAIPDPEPEATTNSAGWRPDLQRRDWTLECQVKLMGTNLTGNLFNFQTIRGNKLCTVYRLSLSNNAPVLVSDNAQFKPVMVIANPLPTNKWVHLAGVWDHKNNSLGMYIDGILAMSPMPMTESFSVNMLPASNRLTLAESASGSFTNRLYLDEVRIWGLARTPSQIAEFAHKLVPPVNGDDVWSNHESVDVEREYYSYNDVPIVNGGSLFDGEFGVPLNAVYKMLGNYWLDDGDGQYNAVRDTLLMGNSNLVEGLKGGLDATILWNDKDHSGDYSRNSLLAYYRFDDGGSSAEDFARHAKNGLLGATFEEFRFGDCGYALPTNAFSFVTNDTALVYGIDKRGADDSDFDGLPDAWEIVHGLDPWEDGTRGESSPGAKDGQNGAKGDLDGDGLINIYEYWAGTNPRFADSDGNGILDSQEDRDGDGVVNITEQILGSRPDMVDTDDDGVADSEEQSNSTSPVNAVDPATSRAVMLGGGRADYLEIPVNINQRLRDWTLESWVMPSNATAGAGVIVRRVVENLASGTQAVNYVMGLEANGAGGLRLYAGYVWPPDGRQFIVRGGTIATGVWSHVAASFSFGQLNSTLILYTNGFAAGSTNTFTLQPPVSGRGGETFVRIGEGFGGAIDEVRLWNKARTEAQIQANTNRVIATSDATGLINDFRFDDGEAVTNSLYLKWSEYHQPASFQDFTYANDWNEQWQHAAIKHGNVAVRLPGAIIPPPSLRVMVQPEEAISGGAQWSLDGGTWQNSGVSLQGLEAGPHTVMFKEVSGWTSPNSLSIILTNGSSMTTNGLYLQKSALKVMFNNVPMPPLAAWQVNSGSWMTNGMIVSNLNAGVNFISYRPVPGYVELPSETVTLIPGQTYSVTRSYTIMMASISVIIAPPEAIAAGAKWQVANATGLVSGAVVSGLPMGTYLIQFSAMPRWIAPANISVTPTNQVVMVVTGLYSQIPGIAVEILPAEAVATGAQWRISNGNWTNNGVFLPLSVGSYTVDFKQVSGGWLAPGSQTALVTAQHVTELSARYLKADVFGGIVSTNAGYFWLPMGLDSDSRHNLFVSDTYNDRIQIYNALSQQWVPEGKFGTAVGQFKKPNGLAVDKLGNLFVADQSNHRIQKRTTNGLWKVIGSNTLVSGTALGQFNGPGDVAVDSKLNLYVADTWNNRVQKCSTAGVWSVFVTNGTAVGRVQYPQGLHVDGSDNLYVSDDGMQTNGLNRVQKFAKTGQYLALLGGRDSTQGSLQDPFGMTIGNGNLYVANSYDSRVLYSDMTGLIWTTLAGSNVLSHPSDVEWDSRGYLYISDTSHNRILMVQVDPAAATNGLTQLTAMTSTGTNAFFTLTWFARLNWNYAVQYANFLAPSTVWSNLPGYSAVSGLNMMTNCTDSTVLGVTNRFYRIIAY